jgi:spore maturation protein A
MNIIWVLILSISVVFAVITGNLDNLTKAIFDAAKSAVEVSLYLAGIISLWLGITKILEDSKLIYRFSGIFRPLISGLFKNIPKDHPAITSITLNFIANLFGLGNAATPLGIKAMQDLKTLNDDPETISFEMMLFIVINTSSIQIVPFTVIGILSTFGSYNPAAVVLPCIIATFFSSVFAVSLLFLFRRYYK